MRELPEWLPIEHASTRWLLRAASALTPLVVAKRYADSSHRLGALLPHLRGEALRKAIWRFQHNTLRNRVTTELRRRHALLPLLDSVTCSNVDEFVQRKRDGQPVILTFAHIGPPTGVILGVVRAGLPVLVPRASSDDYDAHPLPGFDWWTMQPGTPAAALFPKHAVSHLAHAGTLMLGVDGRVGATWVEAPCLGRRMKFQRGLLAIQRLSRAVVIPVHAKWTDDNGIECVFGRALTEGDPLRIEQVTEWFEGIVLADPALLRSTRLDAYLSLPAID